jgi:phage N-6-adenine-methyltransferase
MSFRGYVARTHPLQRIRDEDDDRRTPSDLWARLHREYRFTIDVAASADNALLPRFYTSDDDGLLRSWAGERVWCNPPFSRLEPWVAKAWQAMRAGCELVVMLMPGIRCEQRFWQEYIEPFRDADPHDGIRLRSRFLPGRLRFRGPGGSIPGQGSDRPLFGCVLLTWESVA